MKAVAAAAALLKLHSTLETEDSKLFVVLPLLSKRGCAPFHPARAHTIHQYSIIVSVRLWVGRNIGVALTALSLDDCEQHTPCT